MEPKSTAGSDQMPSCLRLGAVLSLLPPTIPKPERETVQPGLSGHGCLPMVSSLSCIKFLKSLSPEQQGTQKDITIPTL